MSTDRNSPGFLARSKLEPGTAVADRVERRLEAEGIEALRAVRLTLVHAPAGYGKTTTLGQWFRRLREDGSRVAWLSLDEFDATVDQFAGNLLEASAEAGFFDRRQWIEAEDPDSSRRLLLATLSACEGEHVLIFDDLHRAASPDVVRCLNLLVEDLPRGFRIVLGTRALPAELVTADLRLHDRLFEVSDSELRFSAEDVDAYFGARLGTRDRHAVIERLLERTEGWPAALQMVRRRLDDGDDLEATLQDLSGRSADLARYFLEQVFGGLDEDQQQFLLRTSILERVNGDLGSCLYGKPRGWPVLEELERRDLFVHAVDDAREWFRYHGLFREFLLERLRRDGADLGDLHARAASWLQEHEHLLPALQHAQRSGKPELVATILESAGGWLFAVQGNQGLVERALASLDERVMRRFPRVRLASIFLAARRGHLDQALAEMDALREDAPAADPELHAEMEIMSGLLARYGDEIDERQLRMLEGLSRELPVHHHAMHAVRCNLLCAFYVSTGRYDACFPSGDQAIAHFRAFGSVFGEVFIYFHQGYACVQQARLRDAEALFLAGYDTALERFGATSDLAAIGGVFLALVHHERNQAARAQKFLDASLEHVERFDGWLEVYAAAYGIGLSLAQASGDGWRFDELVGRALATARERRLPRLAQCVSVRRAVREFETLGPAAVEAQADEWAGAVADARHPVVRHELALGAGRGLIRAGACEKAVSLMQAEADAARADGRVRTWLSCSILLAGALWQLGRQPEAVAAFEPAVTTCLFEGIKQPFVEESAWLPEVMPELIEAASVRRTNRLREAYLAELRVELRGKRDACGGRGEAAREGILSRRERQALGLLIEGLTYGEMAAELDLSVNTVKFHLKNLYGKLGVRNRRAAIHAAAKARLL